MRKRLFISKVELNLRNKLSKVLHFGHSFVWHWNWTIRKVDQKYEMWCWWRMVKISWTDCVRNEQVLHRVNEERNTLQTTKRRKVNWTGYILRRNCPLRHVTEGKIKGRIEATRRRGRISKQLLDDVKEMRGCWKLKEEALDRTPWKTLFGRGYGPVVRQTTEWMTRHGDFNIGLLST